jgi:hypothetical protein
MESIGFKEWSIVCEALGRGLQSIILRKGGIAEGREGFSFRHREFFLFPTHFHEQFEWVRKIDIRIPEACEGKIEIKYFVRVEETHVVTSWSIVEALEPFHVLQRDVVRERFEYDRAPGIHIALLRAFRLQPVWIIGNEKRYGGCRSWVNLPEPPAKLVLQPVLDDREHGNRRRAFDAVIYANASASSSDFGAGSA